MLHDTVGGLRSSTAKNHKSANELHQPGALSVAMHSEIVGGEEYPLCESFDDTGLEKDLLRNIYAYGIDRPSSVQQRCMLPILDGRDTLLEAQSGVGKTTALIIGCLQRVDCSIEGCQALVLCPTRELAHGIRSVFCSLSPPSRGLKTHGLVGGANIREDVTALRDQPHVVIGTPGRTLDMMNRFVLQVDGLKIVVLDEGQELSSRGFGDACFRLTCFGFWLFCF